MSVAAVSSHAGPELRRFARSAVLISMGCAAWALGVNAILVPNRILSGGLIGLAMVAHARVSWIDLGLACFLMNLPLLVLGWLCVSRRFLWYSILGSFIFPLMTWLIRVPALMLPSPLVAALVAGLICGLGSFLILRSEGSAGGLDILAIWASRRWGLKVGTLIFLINALILAMGAWQVGLKSALYAVVFMFVCGKVIDLANDIKARAR